MSSPYVVLGDRPLDQWKVTELKEELKKRRLTVGGLKVDLIKRLDEAVRHEQEENEKENVDNCISSGIQSELPSEQEITEAAVFGSTGDGIDIRMDSTREVDSGPANEIDDGRLLDKGKVVEGDIVKETSTADLEQEQSAQYAGSETSVVLSETVESVTTVTETFFPSDRANEMADLTVELENDALKPQEDARTEPSNAINEFPQINENSMSVLSPTALGLLDGETQNDASNSTVQLQINECSSLQSNQSFMPPNNQVSKGDHPDLKSQVISDSVSTEPMSLIEKNELKVDVITDNLKLELDVKHEQPSVNSVDPDGGESHPMDVEEPLDNKYIKESLDMKVSVGDTGGNNSENDDSLKNTDAGDLDPPEKISLDRSPRDDFMEDDILESKQNEYKLNDSETIDYMEKSEIVVQKENFVDVVGNGNPLETEVAEAEQKTIPAVSSSKRKFDKEAVVKNDIAKRGRRWSTEVGAKSSEPQSGTTGASTVPGDSAQPILRFSRSNSLVNEESPKERVVPPSSKPPTNSLRIDRFLRPFTLKAVQKLLGKTGTVNSFWMDQIKTHCYVSYSSVEEAVDTRDAVCNLEWPPNGGRLLVAEFVDPEEVKKHVEGPPASQGALAAPPSNATPAFSAQQHGTAPLQPSPRAHVSRQQLPTAPTAKDWIKLPPPPPLATKVEPPIVTLDDLFRKTKAIPRIYYLPLSSEQVAAKKLNKGNVNQ